MQYLYLEEIKSKLVVENATSLEDAELMRILAPCALGHVLMELSKEYRNKGILTYQNLKPDILKYQKTY